MLVVSVAYVRLKELQRVISSELRIREGWSPTADIRSIAPEEPPRVDVALGQNERIGHLIL
jgi:hypothetical protein